MRTFVGLSLFILLMLAGCVQSPIKSDGNKINVSQPLTQPPPNNTIPESPSNVTPSNETSQNSTEDEKYNPKIDPADFTSEVTNKYFTLTTGKKMIYEEETQDGTERVEIYVTNETRVVVGVKTLVVWDRVWLEGDLIEDTRDYYAQDKEGNVWYFGEDTKEMTAGKVINTKGSWEAGVNGAKPGIIMKANPVTGESYRQEYYAGEAEDQADILALNESVSVPLGSFTGCLKTRDWTPLEPEADEHKYYCTAIGGVALEIIVEDNEREELINVEYNSQPSSTDQKSPELKQNITEEQAKQIAIARVPGEVTDVTIEKKMGKWIYVVQIDADNGPETDVIIDIETGEVLGVET